MKKLIVVLSVLLTMFALIGTGMVSSQENKDDQVNWLRSFDDGLVKAVEENKKIFVLITAPSWCKPCQFLEEEIFTDEKIIDILNNKFIPVKILDTDEKELERFEINGYPTLLVYDKEGKLITPITGKFIKGRYKPSDLLRKLKKVLLNMNVSVNDGGKGNSSGGCEGGSCQP